MHKAVDPLTFILHALVPGHDAIAMLLATLPGPNVLASLVHECALAIKLVQLVLAFILCVGLRDGVRGAMS